MFLTCNTINLTCNQCRTISDNMENRSEYRKLAVKKYVQGQYSHQFSDHLNKKQKSYGRKCKAIGFFKNTLYLFENSNINLSRTAGCPTLGILSPKNTDSGILEPFGDLGIIRGFWFPHGYFIIMIKS